MSTFNTGWPDGPMPPPCHGPGCNNSSRGELITEFGSSVQKGMAEADWNPQLIVGLGRRLDGDPFSERRPKWHGDPPPPWNSLAGGRYEFPLSERFALEMQSQIVPARTLSDLLYPNELDGAETSRPSVYGRAGKRNHPRSSTILRGMISRGPSISNLRISIECP